MLLMTVIIGSFVMREIWCEDAWEYYILSCYGHYE